MVVAAYLYCFHFISFHMLENKMEEQQQSESLAKVKGKAVPVYVMMPLDSVTNGHGVNMKKAMDESFTALKSAGVEGVMMDVWWGLVEREEPCVYNWGGYSELMEMARKHGLKVQAVMSFHQCGGNIGDSCNIPLPKWALKEMHEAQELAYTDQWGRRNYEYVSLGCDTLPVLKGRTPVQCYSDFMSAFRDEFKHLLGTTIVEIQVGMGPAGELRYPSYPEQNGTWKFPGIGAFQSFDKYMLKSLKDKATNIGIPEWGNLPSRGSTGRYKDRPENTAFFKQENGWWSSPEGKFFLKWYSKMLLKHGDRILTSANSIFKDYAANVKLSVKVAGIHWHYGTQSHAAELTAGYYNTEYDHDGYRPIAQMLAKHGAIFNFTCIEMQDFEQELHATHCAPQQLVRQVAKATCEGEAIVELAGENALERYDEVAYEQIYKSSMLILDGWEGGEKRMRGFTYLRMNRKLFEHHNWKKFVALVMKMKEGKNARNTPLDHFEKLIKQKVLDDGAAALVHWPQGD